MKVFIGFKIHSHRYLHSLVCENIEIKVPDDSTKFWKRFNRTGASHVMLHTSRMLRAGL